MPTDEKKWLNTNIDLNKFQSTTIRGGKIRKYCTSFASLDASMLIHSRTLENINMYYKKKYYFKDENNNSLFAHLG